MRCWYMNNFRSHHLYSVNCVKKSDTFSLSVQWLLVLQPILQLHLDKLLLEEHLMLQIILGWSNLKIPTLLSSFPWVSKQFSSKPWKLCFSSDNCRIRWKTGRGLYLPDFRDFILRSITVVEGEIVTLNIHQNIVCGKRLLIFNALFHFSSGKIHIKILERKPNSSWRNYNFKSCIHKNITYLSPLLTWHRGKPWCSVQKKLISEESRLKFC